MKKVLKVVGLIVGLAVLGVGGFAAFVHLDWPTVKAPPPPSDLKVEATPARLARGKVLVGIRCVGCHYDQKTGALTGHRMIEAPKQFGAIYSHNITRHLTKGLGRYSDGELVYLLRTGIRRDGVFTGPFMASPNLADEDLYSIIAFLRSDDPWTEPKDVDDRQTEPTFLLKMLIHVAWKPMPVPKAPIVVPPITDKVAYGKYVVHGLGDCFSCHSADFKSMNILNPEKSGGYMGGGNRMFDAAGNVIPTPNLTMDLETGIGKWTEDEFVYAVRTGIRKDGRALRFPMVPFSELSEDEVKAAYAYLKTVPHLHNLVVRPPELPGSLAASASEGEKLFNKYACTSCHGNTGVGICDLRMASMTYNSEQKLSAFIHDPSKFVPGTKMPTWGGIIPEAEFPALIAHVHQLEKAVDTGTAP